MTSWLDYLIGSGITLLAVWVKFSDGRPVTASHLAGIWVGALLGAAAVKLTEAAVLRWRSR